MTRTGRPTTNGLHVIKTVTCPCGQTFEARKPTARYCSNPCRTRFSQYGKGPGIVPRQIDKVWRY